MKGKHGRSSQQLATIDMTENWQILLCVKVAAIQIEHVLVQPSKLKQSLNFERKQKHKGRKSERKVDIVKLSEFHVNYVLTAVESY